MSRQFPCEEQEPGEPVPDDLALDPDFTLVTACEEPVERIALSIEALREIAEACADVDMASMPDVPSTAPCRAPEANPDDWHEPLMSPNWIGFHPSRLDEIAAKLCQGCPVLTECLEWALANPKQTGILGGMTDRGRDALRRERSKASALQCHE